MAPWFTAALNIVCRVLGITERKQSDNNAPDMKARQKAQDEVTAESKDVKDIQQRNLDELRKGGSE